ncbi:MAG TPA: hypothetical protein GX707_20855 [Epulopiscium sp.]|nr:hypothetical protein [Candidatus Epulonipiscium sp.]
MFPNLRAEMARKNIKNTDIAKELTVTYDSISNKNRGKTEYSLSEVLKIRNVFFPGMSLDYLFASEEIQTSGIKVKEK